MFLRIEIFPKENGRNKFIMEMGMNLYLVIYFYGF